MSLNQHAETVAQLLKGRDIDGYEIFVSSSRELSLEAKEGKVDAFRCAEPFGVALRVLKGEGLGFSFSTTMEPDALSRMVDGALVAAGMQSPDPNHLLPLPARYPELTRLYDEHLAAVPEQEKIARTLELERLVLAQDPRVKRVRKCSYSEAVAEELIVNSFGLHCSYRGSFVSVSASAVAEQDGEAQIGWDFDYATGYAGIDPALVARRAAEKATSLLGGRSLKTMRAPVVLDNHVATQLLELLSGSFLGENVCKGKSLFKGREGDTLCSPLVTIRDNGVLEGGMGTAPCDGEGVPQQDTLLVSRGVLQGFLTDSYWGRRLGVPSTGNAVRGQVKGAPRMGTHNLYIEPGNQPLSQLIAGVAKGVLITEVMGMHTANPISGDFSVGAAGFYLEGGEIVHPVKGIAIAGNVLELFRAVDQVADDLRFYGAVGAPALRIEALDVSGT